MPVSFKFAAESPVPCTGLAGGLVLTKAGTEPKLESSDLTPGHTVQGSSLPWNRVVALAPATVSPGFFSSQGYPNFTEALSAPGMFFLHLCLLFSGDVLNHLAMLPPRG